MKLRTPADMRPYQKRGARRVYRHPATGLFVDMGLGKTIITQTGIRGLLRRGDRRGALVVLPLRALETEVWQKEARLWSHTRHLRFSVVHGNEQERMLALHQAADIYLTNYENLQWMAKLAGKKRQLPLLPMPFDILVLDESTFIKNQGSMRFKALKFRLLRFFKTVVILTGTPMPNSLLELWSQIYVLDRGARLGTSFTRFKSRFFEQTDYMGFKWEARTGATERVLRMVEDVVLRLDAKDWIRMPDVVPNTVPVLMPPSAMRLYRKHEREMFLELENLRTISAATAATLSMQCHQMANGAVYDDPDERDSWTEFHAAKLDALQELMDAHPGQSMLITYWFRHDLERLRARWPDASVLDKKDALRTVDDWNAGRIRYLFIQPKSSGHAINMQHGGHTVVWFSLTWSREAHDQLIGRLRRPDQKADSIVNHYLVVQDTVDEAVMEALVVKGQRQQSALDLLRAYAKRRRQ